MAEKDRYVNSEHSKRECDATKQEKNSNANNKAVNRPKRYVNFALIGLSLIFLCNPNIAILDFLPDFIGYILICIALVKFADLNETMSDAHRCFKRLILIDVLKISAMLLIFALTTGQEQHSALMLGSFVAGLIELIFVTMAFLKLFKGLTELGYIYENSSIVPTDRPNARGWTGSIKILTIAFLSFKSVMSFLPELSNITAQDYLAGNTSNNLYRFIGIMRFLAFVPTLLFGCVWIVLVLVYFFKIHSDKLLCTQMDTAYAEKVLPCEHKFTARKVSFSMGILLVACLLCFDFRIENLSIIPDFLAALTFLFFFVAVSKHTKINYILGYILSGVCFGTSVLTAIVETKFFNDYHYDDVYYSEGAYNAYIPAAATAIVNVIVFVGVIAVALLAVKNIIDTHCGRIYIHTENEANQRFDKADRWELYKSLIFAAVGALVYAITDIAQSLLVVDFSFMIIVNIVGAAIFIALFVKLYFDVCLAVKKKYILA